MKYLILVVLMAALILPASASDAPNITSWSNNYTNDYGLELEIDINETVNFNATANQTIDTWNWTLDGSDLNNNFDNYTHTFDSEGEYYVEVYGNNSNGTTQTIKWNVTVEAEKSGIENVISWHPQAVDYIYVNDTVNETITYWIITDEPMTNVNWTVDGTPVDGTNVGNNYSYRHTWNNTSIDPNYHVIIFKADGTDSQVEFRWYVNVYEIGKYGGGNIFDVIDDAVANHVTDIKIRMFKHKAKEYSYDYTAQKVNRLHDEIAKRQMIREALLLDFKAGNITNAEYVAALKQAQRDAKYNKKLAQEMAKEIKSAGLNGELAEILETEDELPKDQGKHLGQLKDKD